MNKLEKQYFFKIYNIDAQSFADAGLDWNMLQDIYADYISVKNKYEEPARFIFNKLMQVPCVHSVRFRIKDAEHLVEKIIRKRIKRPDDVIDLANYHQKITDIIGVRALYLFKNEWEGIHDFIINEWDLLEPPTLYYREGDSQSYLDKVCKGGCEVKKHPFGYRSIHYLIEMRPSKESFCAELQIRTIFEEAWSEIDHEIRYPYYLHHPVFLNQLLILNRLAGTADEMSSYMKDLQVHLAEKEKQFSDKIQSTETAIQSITKKLSSLKNQAPTMEGAVDISDDFTGKIDLTADEIEAVSQILEKVQGVKRINIDTDDDGTPDTFIVQDAVKGRLLAVDKDQDGKVDYYVKL